jgi:Uma2 family endonuclease
MITERTRASPFVGAQSVEHGWPPQGQWTFEDYRRLPDDGWRYEVIEGELYMNPAPSPRHQRAVFAISGRLWEHLQRTPTGQAFTSPIDVILPGLASQVQPDVLFIATDRLEIVKETFIEGAPDWIVEVLSPSNWLDDRRIKFRIYALAGVREYWIVDVDRRQVEVFKLEGQSYTQVGRYGTGEQVHSAVVEGFGIAVDQICPA